MNETLTTIVGNVITDVKQRCTGDGIRVASFRVASNSRRYDKAAEQWVDGERLYVSVTCWRKLARNVSASLIKGDPVVVTGRLYTRGYEVEGQKRSATELEAVAVGPDLSRCLAELDRRRGTSGDVPAQDAMQSATAVTETLPDGSVTAWPVGPAAGAETEAEPRGALAGVGAS